MDSPPGAAGPPEYSAEFRTRFHPDHLADLQRSGLTESTIAALGIYSAVPGAIPRLIGWDPPEVRSALVFPYPGTDDFCRAKVFPPFRDKAGHEVKYLQRAGSGVQLYLTPRAEAGLPDPTVPLEVTEGEKKAAALWQAGLAAIGLGGLWNWVEGGQPLGALDRIAWAGRPVCLAPDSDVWARPDLLQPVYALGRDLEDRGATVQVRQLRPLEGAKRGADDFLAARGVDAYQDLPRFPLTHRAFTQAKRWYAGWGRKRALPRAAAGPAPVARAQGAAGREDTAATLLEALTGWVRRFVVLSEPWAAPVLALWVLGTYGYALAQCFPYVVLISPRRRCGKTRCLKVLEAVSWNASPVTTAPTEAVMFRQPTLRPGALFLDEMERLKEGNPELWGSLVAILDVGFEAGGVVQRAEKGLKGNYTLVDFPVYAPRALATTESLARSLMDRAIVITMLPKTTEERTERWRPRRLAAEAGELGARAAAWMRSHAEEVRQAYEALEEIEPLRGLDDRAQDLLEFLWVLADQAAQDGDATWRDALIACGRHLAGQRAESEREEVLAALIECVVGLRAEVGSEVGVSALLERVRGVPELQSIAAPERLGRWMRRIKVSRVRRRVEAGREWRYVLEAAHLAELARRFLPGHDPVQVPGVVTPPSSFL